MSDMFADLVPAKKAGGLSFDDLVPTGSKRKRTGWDTATGIAANIYRGTGIGDELAAGTGAVVDMVSGKQKPVGNYSALAGFNAFGEAFKRNLGRQRELEDGYAETNPKSAAAARGVGAAASALVPATKAVSALSAAPRAVNMARGAVSAGGQAAAYAAADRGSLAERLKASGEAARNPAVLALGAGAGALAPALPKVKPPIRGDGEVLKEIGVSTSVPQRMGRAAKGVEDVLKRFPITGQAMAGYQDRQLAQLNRGVALKAVQPIGGSIPKEIKPGFEMVQYVDDQLGAVYDKAAKLVPSVKLDKQLNDEFTEIAKRAVDLSDSEAAQFARIINDRTSRFQNGTTGEMVKQIHSELGGLQAEAARKGNATLAAMLGDTRRAIMGTIERANPEAGKLIRKADEGWGVYSIMNDAAAAASARGGVFLPGQLNTQVRASGRAMGSNMAGKGKGNLQDIASAASATIPDTYGNPGTANATLMAGGGWGALTDPTSTAVAGTTLAVIATPYMLMGRKVLEQLPAKATTAQLKAADQQLAKLAANDPAVAELRREVAARLARVVGVGGGALASGSAAPSALSASSQ